MTLSIKNIAGAALVATLALGSAVQAGGYSEPVIEAPIMVEPTKSTGLLVPLLLVALAAAVISTDSDTGSVLAE